MIVSLCAQSTTYAATGEVFMGAALFLMVPAVKQGAVLKEPFAMETAA